MLKLYFLKMSLYNPWVVKWLCVSISNNIRIYIDILYWSTTKYIYGENNYVSLQWKSFDDSDQLGAGAAAAGSNTWVSLRDW